MHTISLECPSFNANLKLNTKLLWLDVEKWYSVLRPVVQNDFNTWAVCGRVCAYNEPEQSTKVRKFFSKLLFSDT